MRPESMGSLNGEEDPIVAEVRNAREQILAKFDYDLGAYFEHLKAVGAENRARGLKYVHPAPNIPVAKPDAA